MTSLSESSSNSWAIIGVWISSIISSVSSSFL